MNEICGDNRFEMIERAKKHLLDATNIDTSPKEMEVLDDFLFRCWQMGWLDRYDTADTPQTEAPRQMRTFSEGGIGYAPQTDTPKCEHITEDGVTCAKYPACDGCIDNPLSKVKGSERLVKGSERTDCQTCKWWSSYGYCVYRECKGYEPQTDCGWK